MKTFFSFCSLFISFLFLTACSKNADLSYMPGVDLDENKQQDQSKIIWTESTIKRNNIQIGQEIKIIANLKNNGKSISPPISLNWMQEQNEFWINSSDDNCSGKKLNSGETCQVIISFSPTTEGQKTRTLEANSDARLTLIGDTNYEDLSMVQFSLNITEHNFTSVLLNEEVSVEITVTNTGNANLINGSQLLSNNDVFSIIENNCIHTLAVGSQCSLKVKYKPIDVGTNLTILSVKYSGQTKMVSIVGTGVVPIIGNPVAENLNFTVNEDQLYSGHLTANDPSGEDLVYTIVSPVTHGVLSLSSGGSFSYQGNLNYYGNDSFVFKVTSESGKISNLAEVQITVNPINDSPISSGQTVAVIRDTAVNISLIATDVESSPLSYILSSPAHGTITGTAPNLIYTPNSGYIGNDSFTFYVNDGELDSNVSTVNLSVSYTNYAPTTSNQFFSTNEDVVLNSLLVATDPNELDVLSFSLVGQAQNGVVSVNSDGTFTYTPNLNYNGIDFFTYKVSDGVVDSGLSLATISVYAVNDAPVATNSNETINEDSIFHGILLASDVDNNPLTYSVETYPENGILVINPNNGNYTYTPINSFSGNDSFKYRAFDGKKYSEHKTVSITVIDVVLPNTAPVANNITPPAFDEDTESIITLSYFDADVELATSCSVSNLSKVTETQVCSCSAGTCTVGITGTADHNGAASFDFMVVVNGQSSNNATATLSINPINDQPVIDGTPITLTTNKNVQASGSFSATDVDLDTLSFSLVSGATNGVAVVNTDGTFTYQPNASYSGSDSFEIKVNDGTIDSSTVIISVTVNNNLICPSNYIKIAENTTLGTTEFCVMQFEAKNNAGIATSSASGSPWVNITATAAKTECNDLGVGYDLISNREWIAISYLIENQAQNWSVSVGSGVLVRGNSDGINGILSVSDTNDPYDQTGDSTVSNWEQRRTFYTSASNLLWDFAGNAWEWVDWTIGGSFDVGFNACTPEAWWELYDIPSVCSPIPNSLDYAPNNPTAISTATYNASYNLGRIYVTSNASWGVAIRGGYNGDGPNAGIYSLALDFATTDSAFNIGFRCVYR